MVRPEKVAVVDEIKERLESSDAIFVTEYRGLSVAQMQALRRALSGSEAEYKIYKMSLTRLAAEAAGMDDITEWLQGPTAIAFSSGDPVPTAKELQDFADQNESLVLKGGVLSGQLLDAAAIKALAKLEPREVLLAKLAGAISAPMTSLAGLMQAVIRQAATVIQQLAEKGGAAPETAAPEETEEPAAEEPAAEEPSAEAEPAEEDAGDEGEEPAVEEPAEEPAEEPSAEEERSAEEEPAEEPAAEAEAEAADESQPEEETADEPAAQDSPAEEDQEQETDQT